MRSRTLAPALSGLLLTALWAAPAQAQTSEVEQTGCPPRCLCYPPPCCTTTAPAPAAGETTANVPVEEAMAAPSLPSLASGVQGGRGIAYGSYIDSALIRNQLRLRYEVANDDNRPDRAEFSYAQCGCFRLAGIDPKAPGPPKMETGVNYQDIRAYGEIAFLPRLSGFVEVPVRFLQPEQNNNTAGLADMNFGFKAALISCDDHVLTFQLRTTVPTGADSRGLGNDLVSLEPALLLWGQITDRLYLEAELRDWIPIGGTDFEGNVLRYGVGLSYFVLGEPQLPGRSVESNWALAPTLEFVGWTVLSGKESDQTGQVFDAAGDTIVNAKFGVRVNYGDHHSFAASYGRALTGAVWYKEIFRVEYRLAF